YRNSARIQAHGGRKSEVIHPVAAVQNDAKESAGEALRKATRAADMNQAESRMASITAAGPKTAFEALQDIVHDDIDVHRVVLAWRAWVLLDFAGPEHALTLLRQSVRFCVQSERDRIDHERGTPGVRDTLPKLFDQHKLAGRPLGKREADEAWIERTSKAVCDGTREQAAETVAAALAEGIAPEAIGEAISLAAARLVLRDPGRANGDGQKPKGSVHGASVGVHASDSANAWRNIARVTDPRNTAASLIVGAYHTGGQTTGLNQHPYPTTAAKESADSVDPASILQQAEAAIKEKNQERVCALIQRYGELGRPVRPVFDLLLKYA